MNKAADVYRGEFLFSWYAPAKQTSNQAWLKTVRPRNFLKSIVAKSVGEGHGEVTHIHLDGGTKSVGDSDHGVGAIPEFAQIGHQS